MLYVSLHFIYLFIFPHLPREHFDVLCSDDSQGSSEHAGRMSAQLSQKRNK